SGLALAGAPRLPKSMLVPARSHSRVRSSAPTRAALSFGRVAPRSEPSSRASRRSPQPMSLPARTRQRARDASAGLQPDSTALSGRFTLGVAVVRSDPRGSLFRPCGPAFSAVESRFASIAPAHVPASAYAPAGERCLGRLEARLDGSERGATRPKERAARVGA